MADVSVLSYSGLLCNEWYLSITLWNQFKPKDVKTVSPIGQSKYTEAQAQDGFVTLLSVVIP